MFSAVNNTLFTLSINNRVQASNNVFMTVIYKLNANGYKIYLICNNTFEHKTDNAVSRFSGIRYSGGSEIRIQDNRTNFYDLEFEISKTASCLPLPKNLKKQE